MPKNIGCLKPILDFLPRTLLAYGGVGIIFSCLEIAVFVFGILLSKTIKRELKSLTTRIQHEEISKSNDPEHIYIHDQNYINGKPIDSKNRHLSDQGIVKMNPYNEVPLK